jgi:hypothetical protein
MFGSRAVRLAMVAAASLAMALLVVMTGSSHEEDTAPAVVTCQDPGPDPAQPVAMPRELIGLEIVLGLNGAEETRWEGDIQVSEGRVLELDTVRATPNSRIDGTHFAVGVPKAQAAAKKKKKQAVAKKKQGLAALAIVRVTLDAPARAQVTVKTGKGAFTFAPEELTIGGRKTFLDGEVSVERQAAALRLTSSTTEDDFPVAVKGADGSVWLAYVEYQPDQPRPLGTVNARSFGLLEPKGNGDRIRLRRYDGKAWEPAMDVTDKGLDLWRPAVAVDGKGAVWIAWAQQVEGDWEIFRRTYTPPGKGGGEGTWSEIVRVTRTPGTDFHVVAATDATGTVWLAWQAWREGNYDILVSAQQEGHAWSTPRRISESRANDWSPAIAADGKGNVYVAWDTYEKGNYDVRLRAVGKDSDAKPRVVADSARFEGRPHLACDKAGRLWIAYEEGDEQWGKDYAHAGPVTNVGLEKNRGFALYVNRTVKVKCLDDERLMVPAGGAEPKFGDLARNKSVPRLAFDDAGGLWLAFRHHPLPGGAGEVWVGSAVRFDGKGWSARRALASSANIIDNRPALIATNGGLLAVYSGDHRISTQTRGQDDLFAAVLGPEGSVAQEPDLVADTPAPAASLETVHPDEDADVARIRAYRVETGGKTLRLLRGEFHRHTEFTSHNDQDGLLEDAWRYAQDAAQLDWMGDGDHDNGFGHEYMWWLIQKVADIHLHGASFIPAQTYERSVVYPNGHRNVMMPRRGIRPLPRSELPGTPEGGSPDTKLLYAYLKHFGGICSSHTSATQMGTDWRDNDPTVEPVVEIYQGHRHNYEEPKAPRAPTAETQIGGFEPAGFVWNALEKGYRLGFQSSSDHVSTHLSYAVVLVEEASRPGIIDAFKKRHSYAATDNIILEVRSGDHLMGDTFETADRPSLTIIAHGTAPIARVHVIRDNKYVFTTEPKERRVNVRYSDDDARPGQSHYYYVRIEQADGNLAWGSPMWVTYK